MIIFIVFYHEIRYKYQSDKRLNGHPVDNQFALTLLTRMDLNFESWLGVLN